MTRPTIHAIIEDGPRAGETVEVDATAVDDPPKEFLLVDDHMGARPADRPVHASSGAMSTYALVGRDEERGGYVYRVARSE